MLGRLLKESEAALLLGFSVRVLQAWRLKDTGPPFVRINRSIRYSPSALERWQKKNQVTPGKEKSSPR